MLGVQSLQGGSGEKAAILQLGIVASGLHSAFATDRDSNALVESGADEGTSALAGGVPMV
jgi:hypothetical protein